MVFVRDLKSEFFNAIVSNRVVIFASLDLDSVCATKILQNLFFVEGVLYTIVPVLSLEEIESKFLEFSRGIKNFIFVNCGATLDLVEVLQPPDGVVFYICDWHRPIDISNVYNAVQVKLLMKQDDSNIPTYDDIYRDDQDENDDDDQDDEQDMNLEALQKRKKKREDRQRWEARREEILFKYSEFAYFARPSAIYCFELAHSLSRDSNDSLFLALTSLTSGFLMGQTSRETYLSEMKSVGSHVTRLNRKPTSEPQSLTALANGSSTSSASSSVHVPGNQMRLTLREDLLLDLYRQWTLYDSLLRTESTACHFRVWSARGMARLREFLADCGIPPCQSQQRFASTPSELRLNVKKYIDERVEKYGMEPSSLSYPVYWMYMGYLYDLSLGDIAMCALGMLEPGNCLIGNAADPAANVTLDASARKDVKTIHSCFAKTGEALSLRNNIDALLSEGGEHARAQLMAISDAAWSVVQARSIARLGPLLYTTLPPMRAHSPLLVQPNTFSRFARYLQHAFCSDVRNARIRTLPFVVLAAYPHDEALLVACGLQPLASMEDERSNCFGKAFEQAAVVSRSRVKPWTFDANLVLIRRDDKDKFMDALVALLS